MTKTSYFDETLETMPPSARAERQNELLRATVAFAYDHAPAVRARFDEAGVKREDIRTVADLVKIPVLSKDALRERQQADPPFGGFLGASRTELKRIFMSPGPLYEPEGNVSDYWRWAPALYAAGFRAGDWVLNIFPYHMTPAGAMFEEGLRALDCTVAPVGVGNQELQLQLMRDLQITGYVGMPSYLRALIKKAEELGHDFRQEFALRRAFVTAEMLPASLRRELQEEYGIDVAQGYGTAEAGNLGYECERRDGLHLPYDAIVQVCDPATGEPLGPGEIGEVVVTLLERTYCLIRFGTGDLSSYTDEPCPCGRTTPRLLGLAGRVGDAVKVRGLFVHPSQAAQVAKRFPEISRYQIVVTRREHKDEMTFRCELRADADPNRLGPALADAIRQILRLRSAVEFVPPGTIPQDAKPIEDERTWE